MNMFITKAVATPTPVSIKQLIKFARDVILEKVALENPKGFYDEFQGHYNLTPAPSHLKNVSDRTDEQKLRVIYQERLLHKLFGRVLALRNHPDKIQTLESGLGLIILKYSQTKGLSQYRKNLFNDMAYQNVWEQMYELKRVLTYRNLQTLQMIESEIDKLILISRIRKRSSLKSSHIFGDGTNVLVRATYYANKKNELDQQAKVKNPKLARVSKNDASRQANHKVVETLKDIETIQEILKKLTDLTLKIKNAITTKELIIHQLHVSQMISVPLHLRVVPLLAGEDITVDKQNALEEINKKYLATESAKTALQKAAKFLGEAVSGKEDQKIPQKAAYRMMVKACYALAFRIYEIHRINGYQFLRNQLYFKNRNLEKKLNHLYDKTLPQLKDFISEPFKLSDTATYLKITEEVKEVIQSCFQYQTSDNIKEDHAETVTQLKRMLNGLWFLYDAQRFKKFAEILKKYSAELKLNAVGLKNHVENGVFSISILELMINRSRELLESENLLGHTRIQLGSILKLLLTLKRNKLWKNTKAMKALGDFKLNDLDQYIKKHKNTLIDLLVLIRKRKPQLY